jgi:hypothetical protein
MQSFALIQKEPRSITLPVHDLLSLKGADVPGGALAMCDLDEACLAPGQQRWCVLTSGQNDGDDYRIS